MSVAGPGNAGGGGVGGGGGSWHDAFARGLEDNPDAANQLAFTTPWNAYMEEPIMQHMPISNIAYSNNLFSALNNVRKLANPFSWGTGALRAGLAAGVGWSSMRSLPEEAMNEILGMTDEDDGRTFNTSGLSYDETDLSHMGQMGLLDAAWAGERPGTYITQALSNMIQGELPLKEVLQRNRDETDRLIGALGAPPLGGYAADNYEGSVPYGGYGMEPRFGFSNISRGHGPRRSSAVFGGRFGGSTPSHSGGYGGYGGGGAPKGTGFGGASAGNTAK